MADYYTLISSLPELKLPEQMRQLPFSRIALENRFSLLESEDRQRIDQIECILFPPIQARTDREHIHQSESILLHYPEELRVLLTDWLELVTFVTALRMRKAGEDARGLLGFGRWTAHIRTYWQEPSFRLEERFSHYRTISQQFEQQEWAEVERSMTNHLWHQTKALESRQPFRFEALAGFWIRWLIIERALASRDKNLQMHFNAWVESALVEIESHLPSVTVSG